MDDKNSSTQWEKLTEDMFLGGNHYLESFSDQKEYVMVIETYVRSIAGSEKKAVVLGLRRLSDGLESKFEDSVSVDRLRKFLDNIEKGATIHNLKGKTVNAFYNHDNVLQVILNKYAL